MEPAGVSSRVITPVVDENARVVGAGRPTGAFLRASHLATEHVRAASMILTLRRQPAAGLCDLDILAIG